MLGEVARDDTVIHGRGLAAAPGPGGDRGRSDHGRWRDRRHDHHWRDDRLDGRGRPLVPEERFNVGGKTRWYGAALLRFV